MAEGCSLRAKKKNTEIPEGYPSGISVTRTFLRYFCLPSMYLSSKSLASFEAETLWRSQKSFTVSYSLRQKSIAILILSLLPLRFLLAANLMISSILYTSLLFGFWQYHTCNDVFCQYHVEKKFCVPITITTPSLANPTNTITNIRNPSIIRRTNINHPGKNHYQPTTQHTSLQETPTHTTEHTMPIHQETHTRITPTPTTPRATHTATHTLRYTPTPKQHTIKTQDDTQERYRTTPTTTRCQYTQGQHQHQKIIHQDKHNHRTTQVHLLFLEKPYMSS